MQPTFRISPLTPEVFAPFGTVLGARGEAPATTYPEVLEHADVPGAFTFAVLQRPPVALATLRVAQLERHPYSAQSFLPIVAGRWLVLVTSSLSDGTPDQQNAHGFLPGPDQAICIARDVWHAGLTVFDRPAQIGMLMWKAESGGDGIVHDLATPLALTEE